MCLCFVCDSVCVRVYVTCMSLCANRCVSVWEDEAVGAYLNVSLCVGMCRCVCVSMSDSACMYVYCVSTCAAMFN